MKCNVSVIMQVLVVFAVLWIGCNGGHIANIADLIHMLSDVLEVLFKLKAIWLISDTGTY
jgi:Co/Zn/Cd efflux system component